MKHGDTNSTSGELSNEAEEQYTLPLKFGIEKVSELGDDQWTSPGFYTHSKGYRMCLKVHLGSYQERGDYLSCFLHLMSGPYDAQLEWPFRAQFEVVLMNQNKDEPDWSRDINFLRAPCLLATVAFKFKTVRAWPWVSEILNTSNGKNSMKGTF